MSDKTDNDPIMAAYGRYDADPRVNGMHDYEAFQAAVGPLVATRPTITKLTEEYLGPVVYLIVIEHLPDVEAVPWDEAEKDVRDMCMAVGCQVRDLTFDALQGFLKTTRKGGVAA